MPDTTRAPDLTVEEQLRAAQGVLLLLAEILTLHSVAPDGVDHGFSTASSDLLARLCRQHGGSLDRLVQQLPATTLNATVARGRTRTPRSRHRGPALDPPAPDA